MMSVTIKSSVLVEWSRIQYGRQLRASKSEGASICAAKLILRAMPPDRRGREEEAILLSFLRLG